MGGIWGAEANGDTYLFEWASTRRPKMARALLLPAQSMRTFLQHLSSHEDTPAAIHVHMVWAEQMRRIRETQDDRP